MRAAIRLSEAILLGSTMVKGTPGRFFMRNDEGAVIGACALGMALIAVGETGMTFYDGEVSTLTEKWPWLNDAQIAGGLLECASRIAIWYDQDVALGEMTMEQFIDRVRDLELARDHTDYSKRPEEDARMKQPQLQPQLQPPTTLMWSSPSAVGWMTQMAQMLVPLQYSYGFNGFNGFTYETKPVTTSELEPELSCA